MSSPRRRAALSRSTIDFVSSSERFVMQTLEFGQPRSKVERASVDLDLPCPSRIGFTVDEHMAFTHDPADEGGCGRPQVDDVDGRALHGFFGPHDDAAQGHRTARVRVEHHGDVEVPKRRSTRRRAEEVRPANRRVTCERMAQPILAAPGRVARRIHSASQNTLPASSHQPLDVETRMRTTTRRRASGTTASSTPPRPATPSASPSPRRWRRRSCRRASACSGCNRTPRRAERRNRVAEPPPCHSRV